MKQALKPEYVSDLNDAFDSRVQFNTLVGQVEFLREEYARIWRKHYASTASTIRRRRAADAAASGA